MDNLPLIFKTVSMIFAVASVATGAQAIIDPTGFSKTFGLPLQTPINAPSSKDPQVAAENTPQSDRAMAMSYISLAGVRQLGTAITILTFALQDKWTEVATILAIIGIVVAGTDGIYIARGATRRAGLLHAIPGALIAALAGAVIYSST